MPLDRQREVGRAHAGAVVGDADQRQAAGRRHHLDVAGAGIERVLDQLLDHAAGRSITSPAAMRLTVSGLSWRMGMVRMGSDP